MTQSNPHFQKHHKIAVIGAGPAGIHMASLLKKKGYENVTVLERENRIGGKSYTHVLDEIPYEMGTCYLHNGYHRVKELIRSYGLQDDISPKGRSIFLDNNPDYDRPLELNDYAVLTALEQYKNLPKSASRFLAKMDLLKAIWRYSNIYKRIFGTTKLPYAIPLHLSDQVLEEIDMTFLEFLQLHKLDPLIGLMKLAQPSQGYGYLEKIPAYYGLCWAVPEVLTGAVKQIFGLTKILTKIPDGYECLWNTVAEKDNLFIRLGTIIHSIQRQDEQGSVAIELTDSQGERQIETYDFLVLAINLRSALKLLSDSTDQENNLFSALTGFTLTSTLYESDPVSGYSTADYDKAIATFADVLSPEHDNEWYADRNEQSIVAKNRGEEKNFNRQTRIAFQFSKQEPSPDGIDNNLFLKDSEIAAKLEQSWAKRGVKNTQIIKQYSWPYFMHFPGWAVRRGYPSQLFACQGHFKTWYTGGSACFESVNHIVNYNHALVDTYL